MKGDLTKRINAADKAAASSCAIIDQMRALDELISRYRPDGNADRGSALVRGEDPGPKALSQMPSALIHSRAA